MAKVTGINTTSNFQGEEKQVVKEIDPMEVMVDYIMPKGAQGENQMMSVHINGYEAYFQRGKKIRIPYPVYLVLRRTVKAEEAHAKMIEEMHGDFKLN